ncbi:hypothetical protein HYG81_18855 [Natrinema zhouii]|nr:hypothetical protein [Natrinema zhouii]UHQ97921.1 hypothetical protein HYG81_18855 [Natrinema zhouii]
MQPRGEPNGETITVTKEGRWYVARDESSRVASQVETKSRGARVARPTSP